MNILCSKSNEYVYEKDGKFFIGITDEILHKLGNIIDISFPKKDEYYTKGEIFAALESDLYACEFYMPVGGKIEEINQNLINNINNNSMMDNWIIQISSTVFDEDSQDLTLYETYKKEFV